MAYQWILFDLDDTLFDFPAPRALELALAHYSVTLTPERLADYQTLNQALWQQYNAGDIDAATLKAARFRDLAPLAGVDPQTLNAQFMQQILHCSRPLEGVVDTLRQLQGKVRMGIITNGFADVQRARLEHSGLADCFEWMVISEELGVPKPDPRIFQCALTQMDQVAPADVLMVGDNPQTDVAGAAGVGMDTCWFNSQQWRFSVSAGHIIDQFASLLQVPRVAALLAG